jgi:hypothetical protein
MTRRFRKETAAARYLLAGTIGGSNYPHSAVFVIPFIQKPDKVQQRDVGRHRHESNL